ncbi:class I SAM-dependent methyltransferase [Zavarzinella formosa]|uniref:class I SAM-dependent methyltransferase n=1 Tax=Zavarzinella formosa TaxID=360055 RepID=UPI00036E2A0D|nr:class I SAM-dependent methyltransferase [Zavarzinella formosa]
MKIPACLFHGLKSETGPVSDHSLTPEDISRFFDKTGWTLAFANALDRLAYSRLLSNGHFSEASAVLDIGAGVGHLADRLLKGHLSPACKVTLIEVAASLASRLKHRFARFGERVRVELINPRVPYPLASGSFDRIVSTYVFEMMNHDQLVAMTKEAHRLLKKHGLLCLLTTSRGNDWLSRINSEVSSILYCLDPRFVGLSRLVNLRPYFHASNWELVFLNRVSHFGFCSEATIFKKISDDGSFEPAAEEEFAVGDHRGK